MSEPVLAITPSGVEGVLEAAGGDVAPPVSRYPRPLRPTWKASRIQPAEALRHA